MRNCKSLSMLEFLCRLHPCWRRNFSMPISRSVLLRTEPSGIHSMWSELTSLAGNILMISERCAGTGTMFTLRDGMYSPNWPVLAKATSINNRWLSRNLKPGSWKRSIRAHRSHRETYPKWREEARKGKISYAKESLFFTDIIIC